jgi:hypothetical protein
MYAVLPFGIATGLVEMPYLLLQAIIFVPVIYFMIGFKVAFEPFLLFVIIFMQSITLYTFMGQLFAYLAPTAPVAALLGGLNHFLWNIFNGFLVPNPIMAKGWLWLNYISATTYVIHGLAASQLGQEEKLIVVPGVFNSLCRRTAWALSFIYIWLCHQQLDCHVGYPGCSQRQVERCPTVRVYLDEYFGYEYSFRWWCVLILFGFIVVFRVASMIVLKVINHEHR